MEKYKIICIVIFAVLLFQIRGSQSRSLNDDELEHTISDKIGSIEDWTTECVCFPKTIKGTPVSKSLPSYEQIDRLVVYFYRNKISGELTYYIPSWKKQIDFPDLTFDIGDKLETGTIDGIIHLFDTATHPETLQVTTVTKGIPLKNVVTVNPGVHVEITNITYSNNEHKNNSGTSQSGLKQITVVEIPSKESTVSVVSPENDKKITTGITIDQDLNLSLGTNQQPLKGNIINVPNQNLKPLENHQNPQVAVISGGSLANLLPGKPETEGGTIIINPPENQIEISNKPLNQKLVSPIGQQNQLIKGVPHVSSNNLNLAINRPTGLGELMKYVLPGHGVLVSPSKSNNGISSWIDTTNQNKQTNLINIGRLPSKYNNPTFNNWFNEQILTIRSQRPSMSHTINFHVLKLLLIKALHENGISVSENGDLRDSNGNILKMTNLKIRPILLGDPMDYQKLIDTKKCVIPYDLPYLEAVLVTLIYPPRILAIIPLGVENVFISALPGKTAPNLCGQSKCHTLESSRSGLSEKEEDISDINDSKHLEASDDDLYNTEQKSEEPIDEEVPTYSNNIESKNAYTYMATNPPEDFSLEQKYEDHNTLPWDIKDSNSQNTLLRGLTPSESDLIIWRKLLPLVQSDPGISGRESMYINDIIPIGFKKNCGHKYCQINESFRSGLPEKEEQTSFKIPLNLNKANEENDDNATISGESDGTIEENMDYMAANEDLPVEANSDSQIQSNSEILDGRILFPKGSHFRSSLSEVDKPRNGLNTILDNEDNDENLQFEEKFGKTLENNEPIYYSNDVTPLNDHSYAARRNNLPLPIIDNSQNSLFQPSQIIYTQPQFGSEVFYLDDNGNVEGRKSLEDLDDSLPEIPQTPDEEDYDMLHIRIVGGNPATSSGTPVSSRGRSGLNSQ